MRPVDPVTLVQAAAILGCSTSTVRRYVVAGRLACHGGRYEHRSLSLTDVEQFATQVYRWRRHVDDPAAYWVTGQAAADVLGLSRARVTQLAVRDRLPFVVHCDGTRLYRRAQLVIVAASWRRSARLLPTTLRGELHPKCDAPNNQIGL